jgi:hypothetical protein
MPSDHLHRQCYDDIMVGLVYGVRVEFEDAMKTGRAIVGMWLA